MTRKTHLALAVAVTVVPDEGHLSVLVHLPAPAATLLGAQ